jgi:O-antigen/teichoic acid export membrane protein
MLFSLSKRLIYGNMSKNVMSLINDGIIYTLLNVLNRIVPFLLLPIILKFTSTEVFGHYSYFILIETILLPITSLNFSAAYTTHFYSETFSKAEYLSTTLFSILFSSILIFVLYVLLSPLFVPFVGLTYKFMCLAIALAFFNNIVSTCLNLFRLERKPWMYGSLSIFQSIVLFVWVYLFVKDNGVYENIVMARFFAFLVVFVLTLFFFIHTKRLVFKFNFNIFKSIFRFGFPTVFYSLSAFIFLNSDRYFVNHFLGVNSLGIYSAVVQVCAVMSIFNSSLNAAWMPWLFENLKKKTEEVNIFICKVSYLLILLVIIFGLTLFLSLPFIAEMLLPKSFNYYLYLSIPIIIGYIFEAIYLILSPYVYFVGLTKYNAFIGVFVAIINVALNLFLVPYYGLVGAAISTMTSWIVLVLSFALFSSKVYPMPWFLFKKILR